MLGNSPESQSLLNFQLPSFIIPCDTVSSVSCLNLWSLRTFRLSLVANLRLIKGYDILGYYAEIKATSVIITEDILGYMVSWYHIPCIVFFASLVTSYFGFHPWKYHFFFICVITIDTKDDPVSFSSRIFSTVTTQSNRRNKFHSFIIPSMCHISTYSKFSFNNWKSFQ